MRLKEIYNLAVCAEYISNNPMIGINRLFKLAKVEPRKSINYKELPNLLIKIESFPIKIKLVFLLSLFTLLRPGEIVKLKRSWIRNDILVIPSEEMKNKKEFRIPLNPIIIKLLEIVKKNNKHKRSNYLFTGTKNNKHLCIQVFRIIPQEIVSTLLSDLAKANGDPSPFESTNGRSRIPAVIP